MKKRVTYRPSKAQGALGVIWGGIFILIGLVVVIPTFGAFGLLWTLSAVAITGVNAYQTFGKGYVGPEIHIEDENVEKNGGVDATSQTHDHIQSTALSPKGRLEQLKTLKEAGLLTEKEYEEKRREILKGL